MTVKTVPAHTLTSLVLVLWSEYTTLAVWVGHIKYTVFVFNENAVHHHIHVYKIILFITFIAFCRNAVSIPLLRVPKGGFMTTVSTSVTNKTTFHCPQK